MLLAPARLDVRAWLALALNGPIALLALAVAATASGAARLVAWGVVLVSAPALALAYRALKLARLQPAEGVDLRPATRLDHALLIAFFLGVAGACGVLLAAAIRFRLDDDALAVGLGLTGPPLGVIVAIYILLHARRPAPGVQADKRGLKLLASGELMRWGDIDEVKVRHHLTRFSTLRLVVRQDGVRIVRSTPVPVAFPPGALPRLLRYVKARLEAVQSPQAIEEPQARRWQRTIQRIEDERLQEVTRQVEPASHVPGAEPRLGGEQEGRQGEQPLAVGFAGLAGDGAAGPRADVDEVVDGPGGGAFRQVEAEAQVLEQASLEAHEDRGPDVGIGEGGAERFEGEESPWMGFALGQRPGGDGGRGGDPREGQGVVEERGGALPLGFEAGGAELVGDAGAIADAGADAGLQDGLELARGAAGDMGCVLAMGGGEQFDDGARLAERARGEDEGVVIEFHPVKLWAPAPEIQPLPAANDTGDAPAPIDDPQISASFEAALAELLALVETYRDTVVEPGERGATGQA